MSREQQVIEILNFFEYNHLPEGLQETSKIFHELAHKMDRDLWTCDEKIFALRKLLEAKDCAVRANLWKRKQQQISKEVDEALRNV